MRGRRSGGRHSHTGADTAAVTTRRAADRRADRRPVTRLRFLGAALAALFVLGVAAAPMASAHASVVSTDPVDGTLLATAPDHVSVTFDEGVELQTGAIHVFAPDGSRAEVGEATHLDGRAASATVSLRAGLPDGTYIASWQVISADSHPARGAFTFSIGTTSAPARLDGGLSDSGKAVGVAYGIARWIAYLGFAVLVGSAVLMIAFAPALAGSRRARRILAGGWFALMLGTFASLLLQGPYGAGYGLGRVFGSEVLQETLRTHLGKALAWRLVLLGAAGVYVSWIATRLPAATVQIRRAAGAAGVVIAIALASTWAATDHSSVGKQVGIALPADILHLLAMATWIGGVTLLAAVVLRRDFDLLDDRALVVRRFSSLAFASVTVLVVTGTYQGWRELGTPAALTDTVYGRLLLLKVAGFLALIALGYFARQLLQHEHPDLQTLRRSVGAEFGIALGVLAVTALLVSSQPAKNEVKAPVSVTAPFDTGSADGTGTVNVIVDPARVGSDTLHLYVLGANGRQESVPEVQVALSLPSQQLGPLPVKLDAAGPGHYIGTNVSIPFAGNWQIVVTVRTTDIDQATVIVNAQVK